MTDEQGQMMICCICGEPIVAGQTALQKEGENVWRHFNGCSPWAKAFNNQAWVEPYRRQSVDRTNTSGSTTHREQE